MEAGGAVLLPAGTEHGLASEPDVMMGDCDRERADRARANGGVLQLGSPPTLTSLVTLHYEHDPQGSTPVLTALERPVHVAASERAYLDTVRLLTRELAHPQIGTTAAVNSIIDLLLVQFVQAWLSTQPVQRPSSWFGALFDPVVRDARRRMHGRDVAVSVVNRHKKTKIGYDYIHTAIDDHTRLAYSEILPDEKDPTCGLSAPRSGLVCRSGRHRPARTH